MCYCNCTVSTALDSDACSSMAAPSMPRACRRCTRRASSLDSYSMYLPWTTSTPRATACSQEYLELLLLLQCVKGCLPANTGACTEPPRTGRQSPVTHLRKSSFRAALRFSRYSKSCRLLTICFTSCLLKYCCLTISSSSGTISSIRYLTVSAMALTGRHSRPFQTSAIDSS